MTSELFTQLVLSDAVNKRIELVRRLRSEGKLKAADLQKRQLPLLCFCASSFDVAPAPKDSKDGKRKKGDMGRWRLQSTVNLNGMYMVDYDHIGDPKKIFKGWWEAYAEEHKEDLPEDNAVKKAAFCNSLGILYAAVTSSGEGLRLVGKADVNVGNLVDNQMWLSQQLGLKLDESCKDASRGSFINGFEDILFINKEELFSYDNQEFNNRYCGDYRDGHSSSSSNNHHSAASNISRSSSLSSQGAEGSAGETAQHAEISAERSRDYKGVSYERIIEKWFECNAGGRPAAGDRHRQLYSMACDLRYITDFDPKLLSWALQECPTGKEIADERGADELDNIARDACALQRYRSIPKRMRDTLEAVGIQQSDRGNDKDSDTTPEIDYESWANRTNRLLYESVGYKEACATLPERIRLAGILASGAMFGTYLTRCWWSHFDGKDYRLSYLVYVIGEAASGKSFIVDLDRLIMAPMLAADKVGRAWERQYKEDMKRRSVSGKTSGAAPEQQHPVIRYVPSTISNAMMYRRLMDAIDNDSFDADGNPIHLHVYTLEPELATALRAQTGSWAGKNDIELKSFHNEYAGVDFANDASVNGNIQINWNQVISGTYEALGRKIRPSMILDGLVTRLVVFPMPSNDFMMLERRKVIRDHEREAYLRSIGLKLEQLKGEIEVPKLIDYCYEYEEELTKEARREGDSCLDYFRKRIPVIMIRYTIVRIVLREIDKMLKGEKPVVLDSDLEFAKLIGDWCLMAQMRIFGTQVMEAKERESQMFVPRRRTERMKEIYKTLPEILTTTLLVEKNICTNLNNAGVFLRRWCEDGLVEKVNHHEYKKKFKELV